MRLLLFLSALLLLAAGPGQAADPARGATLFKSHCARCHGFDPAEQGKRGPHLKGLFARRYGAVEGFPYRMVWPEADPVWTAEHLDNYLEIHRLPEPEQRADVIAYLRQATAP